MKKVKPRLIITSIFRFPMSGGVNWLAPFVALVTLILTGCGSGWSGPHKEAGPLPLSSSDKPIIRLVDKMSNYSQGEMVRLLWDEGDGPVLAVDRINPLLASIPKELNDRLHSTRDVPANLYPPLAHSGGTTYEYIYDVWEMVISLNPDVLIVSVHERPVGPHSRLPRDWDLLEVDRVRREYLTKRIESISGGVELNVCAGTVVPWSEEMYVFSTDPKVRNGRLVFEGDHAEILLPAGKLRMVRHDNDVDVTRD